MYQCHTYQIHLYSYQFDGINRGLFRKHGTVSWLKDGTHYDPATDGKDVMVRGFEINSFKPEDAGVYEAQVKLESKDRKERCNATVVVEMIGKLPTVNYEIYLRLLNFNNMFYRKHYIKNKKLNVSYTKASGIYWIPLIKLEDCLLVDLTRTYQ